MHLKAWSEPTCQMDGGAAVQRVSGARRCPLAEEGVHAVRVATEGSQGQRAPPCFVPMVHFCLPLQQHLQGLSVAMVCL